MTAIDPRDQRAVAMRVTGQATASVFYPDFDKLVELRPGGKASSVRAATYSVPGGASGVAAVPTPDGVPVCVMSRGGSTTLLQRTATGELFTPTVDVAGTAALQLTWGAFARRAPDGKPVISIVSSGALPPMVLTQDTASSWRSCEMIIGKPGAQVETGEGQATTIGSENDEIEPEAVLAAAIGSQCLEITFPLSQGVQQLQIIAIGGGWVTCIGVLKRWFARGAPSTMTVHTVRSRIYIFRGGWARSRDHAEGYKSLVRICRVRSRYDH